MIKKIVYIIIVVLFAMELCGQNENEVKFSINGIIGVQNVIPMQNVLVEINDESVYTNVNGEFTLDKNVNIVHIKIHHWGFSNIDTIFELSDMDKNIELYMISDCEVNGDLAKSDIAKNKMKLWLVGGSAPTIVIGQDMVSMRYGFEYRDFGCTPPSFECIVQYNNHIFKELDKSSGSSWRQEIRDDVIGFKEYVTKNE